ncbi:hypothetical protein G9A89_016249 [Geosiphon pyriformis]|nr:hypothetical protein G9A89_016249 [Geosiphon pyriformis]
MANSKFEYVKSFEKDESLLPNTWLVVRLDGRSFHKFSIAHHFEKPNDSRALQLMNKCAMAVMDEVHDIVIGYGESDEFSLVLKKNSSLYNRRESKILTTIVSLFSSNYVYHWKSYFPNQELKYPPSFDGRIILYPADQNLKDYLSWRQADCHINNLYNTCFWALVHSGKTEQEAENTLKGTVSAGKNELLFSQFGINYNDLPKMYRKGSILIRKEVATIKTNTEGQEIMRQKKIISIIHEDVIKEKFWKDHAELEVLLR